MPLVRSQVLLAFGRFQEVDGPKYEYSSASELYSEVFEAALAPKLHSPLRTLEIEIYNLLDLALAHSSQENPRGRWISD